MTSTLPRRLAVITGTARVHGIGRSCARAFVRAGFSVLGVDVSKADEADEDHGFQERYRHVVVDISNPAEVAFLPKALHKHFGDHHILVDCLVNNAGIADPHLPQDGDVIDRWRQVIDVNLTGKPAGRRAFVVTQTLLPHLAPGASIIHISSTRAVQSEPHTEAYAAAKAGLLGLTHAQAVSLAGKARVNAVLPGWIDTLGDPASLRQVDHDWHAVGRVGVPQDIAEACLFLADSSKSGFITGQHFAVCGGTTIQMRWPE
ncbi:hypothetical protein N2152v2_008198 [Parachlorella kessleri]